jgi:hypothetical protein
MISSSEFDGFFNRMVEDTNFLVRYQLLAVTVLCERKGTDPFSKSIYLRPKRALYWHMRYSTKLRKK